MRVVAVVVVVVAVGALGVVGAGSLAQAPPPQPDVTVKGQALPRPSEDQPIPASAIGPQLWTPGGTAQEVWTSATEHNFVFSNPRGNKRLSLR